MAEYRQLRQKSRADRLESRRVMIEHEKNKNESKVYYGDKKNKRIKYKTKDNDKFENQERRLLEEQEVLIRLHL